MRHRDRVYLLPTDLRERLEDLGLSYAEGIARWRDDGVIETEGRHMARKISWDAKRTRVISVLCDAVGLAPHEMVGEPETMAFEDE